MRDARSIRVAGSLPPARPVKGSAVPRWRDEHEILGWKIAGGMMLGLLAIWMAGLTFHSLRPATPILTGTPELLRPDAGRPLKTRMITFAAVGRDMIAIDAETKTRLRQLDFDRDGFIVATVKTQQRDRKLQGATLDAPFRLILWDNGQVVFEDPETGAQLELSAFGHTNAKAFAALLAAPGEDRRTR